MATTVTQYVLTACNRFVSPEGKVYEKGTPFTPANADEVKYIEAKADFKKFVPTKTEKG